jgi:hypothetical protein
MNPAIYFPLVLGTTLVVFVLAFRYLQRVRRQPKPGHARIGGWLVLVMSLGFLDAAERLFREAREGHVANVWWASAILLVSGFLLSIAVAVFVSGRNAVKHSSE